MGNKLLPKKQICVLVAYFSLTADCRIRDFFCQGFLGENLQAIFFHKKKNYPPLQLKKYEIKRGPPKTPVNP
jgi:hypothetical protein